MSSSDHTAPHSHSALHQTVLLFPCDVLRAASHKFQYLQQSALCIPLNVPLQTSIPYSLIVCFLVALIFKTFVDSTYSYTIPFFTCSVSYQTDLYTYFPFLAYNGVACCASYQFPRSSAMPIHKLSNCIFILHGWTVTYHTILKKILLDLYFYLWYSGI